MMADKGPGDRQPVIQTITMPADANGNGDIFGGWVLSQMDIAGGVAAGRVCTGRCATVAIEAMTFHRPISIGDLVSVYADVTRIGNTSVSIHIDTYVTRRDESHPIKVTEGTFVYVAIDENGRPRPVPQP